MRPQLFKNSKDLVQFISRLPRVSGSVKVDGVEMTSDSILDECASLSQSIFRYKEVLAKGRGGLGNNKSVVRFSEIVADNAVQQADLQYQAALNAIQEEIEGLINGGVATEIANSLGSAKSALEAHNLAKNVIKKFEAKLNARMSVVKAAYAKLSSELETLQKKHAKDRELSKALGASREEISKSEEEANKLLEAMVRYCDLQVGYASLCAAAAL